MIYFAAPLFSQAERDFNNKCKEVLIKSGITDVYFPQDNASINDKSGCATSKDIYKGDTDILDKCEGIITVIDGESIDPGVAAEIGYICGKNSASNEKKRFIIGICTDNREPFATNTEEKNRALNDGTCESQYLYRNLYVIGAINKYGYIVPNIDFLSTHIEYFRKEFNKDE